MGRLSRGFATGYVASLVGVWAFTVRMGTARAARASLMRSASATYQGEETGIDRASLPRGAANRANQ